jgi:hypothetical protein
LAISECASLLLVDAYAFATVAAICTGYLVIPVAGATLFQECAFGILVDAGLALETIIACWDTWFGDSTGVTVAVLCGGNWDPPLPPGVAHDHSTD